jgi:hypothetical protein
LQADKRFLGTNMQPGLRLLALQAQQRQCLVQQQWRLWEV